MLAETGGGHDATGISCFWHSLLLLDERDRPLTPVLLWQDRRSVAQAEELRERLDPASVHDRTGCFLHPSFWPAKLAWLREQGTLDEARRVVSFADYLFLRLTGELRTTLSTASGSGLLDLRARAGTPSCSTRSGWTSSCCRRSPTSPPARPTRRSATAPARTSAPAARPATAPR